MRMRASAATVAVAALVLALAGGPAASAADSLVSVGDVADTYTASNAPTTDFGTSSSLGVYATPSITSVVRFVLPAAPAGQLLSSATLRLHTSTIASAGSVNAVNVRTASDSWTETGTFYANRPAVSGPVLGTLPGGTVPDREYDVALNASAVSVLLGRSTTFALEGTGGDSLWLWSRTMAASLRPVLLLTFTGSTPPPPPPPPASVTVMAAGDIACASGSAVTSRTCRFPEVASTISAAQPYRFLQLGDMQYQQSTLTNIMAPGAYNDTFGQFKSITLPSLGNHEFYDGTNGYFDYYYGPGVGSGPFGARGAGYYAATLGSWQFISLDTECDAGGVTGGCAQGSPEYNWLQNQLTGNPSQCTMVIEHRPRWSTGASHGSYPAMSALWDLMAANHVDVVLAGHNHVSETFKPIGVSGSGATPTLAADGIRAFTVGTGGADLQNLTPSTNPLMAALDSRSNSAFGPLRLTLGAGSYSWDFLPVPGMAFTNDATTGSFSGSGTCH